MTEGIDFRGLKFKSCFYYSFGNIYSVYFRCCSMHYGYKSSNPFSLELIFHVWQGGTGSLKKECTHTHVHFISNIYLIYIV